MTHIVKHRNNKRTRFSSILLMRWVLGTLVVLPLYSNPLHAEVKVQIAPARVSLSPEKLQMFTPSVTGADNNAVAWSREPALGEINPETGEFTAPKYTGCEKTTIVIKATSLADRSAFATATVELAPA